VDIPVRERDSFQRFAAEHESKVGELRGEFMRITEGGAINKDSLYKATDSIMGGLSTKNDVFVYSSQLLAAGGQNMTHSVNVSMLAHIFGIWINAGEEELKNLTVAGLLHDIGMSQVPEELIKSKKRLSKADRELVRKHTTLGYRILDNADMPNEVKLAALGHHERLDGSGYPLGLRGDKISKFAKIIAICDTYEAMTADRAYRARICPFDVIRTFERGSFGSFDTEALLLFLQNIAFTYLSSRVVLTDGSEGVVAFIHQDALSTPIVRRDDGSFVDLKADKSLRVFKLA
jgi:putative nucleotidyltransferase with HDIG domain